MVKRDKRDKRDICHGMSRWDKADLGRDKRDINIPPIGGYILSRFLSRSKQWGKVVTKKNIFFKKISVTLSRPTN